MAPPPWHVTPDGQWHAKRILQLLQPQKQLCITGEVLSEAGRSQQKGFLHPTDRMCLFMLRPVYTHSRAAKRPLAASLLATPALGHRRCLIVFTVFRGAANDPEMFSVADRQEKDTTPPSKQLRCMFSRFCTPSHRLPRKGLQHLNLRWSHSLSTHTPAVLARYLVHQSSHLPFIKINTSTKMDSDQTPGRTGQQEAPGQKGSYKTVQNVRWPTSFVTPTYSLLGLRDQDHIS